MHTCYNCQRETEYLYVAYLPERKTINDVCEQCRVQLQDYAEAEFVETIVKKLTNFVNSGSSKELGTRMAKMLKKEHRFLQSEFIMTLFHMFESYRMTQTDLRNEWAVKYADRCYNQLFAEGE